MFRRLSAAVAILAVAASLAGCAGSTVSMQPAEYANDPACADVTVRLPGTVDGEQRRWTDAQATGAWGAPAAVLLTCGLEPPAPTTTPCIQIGGVDWLVDDSDAPRFTLTTYGRTPAAQVYIDNEIVGSNNVLEDLAIAVGQLPKDSACTDPSTIEGAREG